MMLDSRNLECNQGQNVESHMVFLFCFVLFHVLFANNVFKAKNWENSKLFSRVREVLLFVFPCLSEDDWFVDILNARSSPHDWWKKIPKRPWPGPGVKIIKVSTKKILLK